MELVGVFPPMITPVTGRTGSVDREIAGTLSNFLVDGGVHGLFPCGSIGEFSSLTRAQRAEMIETVVDHASDVPVLAGCGGTSVEDVCNYVADAADVGANAGVVVTPYYMQTSQGGLREFYQTVADRSPLPIILYNIPPITHQSIAPGTVSTLAEHSNIVGIKDSSGDLTYHFDLITQTPDDFSVMQGISELAVASLDAGADGLVMGPANVFPDLHAELYDAYQTNNRNRAVEVVRSVTSPVVSASQNIPTASALKYLLTLTGYDVEEPLLPLPLLSDTEKQRLEECYERIQVAV